MSVVRKKCVEQIEFILSRTTKCICRFFCIEHFRTTDTTDTTIWKPVFKPGFHIIVSVVSVVQKKIHRTGRIHSISYNTLCLSFLLYWAVVREVSIKLYLFYEFFSYDRHDRYDRYDRYNDMETRLYKFSVKCIVSYAAVLCLVTQRSSNAGCENLIDNYARLHSSQSCRLNFSAVAWVVVELTVFTLRCQMWKFVGWPPCVLHSKCNQFTFVVAFNCLIEMFVCVSVIRLYAACSDLQFWGSQLF